MAEKIIEKIVNDLVRICEEHEVLPWECPYLKPGLIPPQNPVTKTVYSGGNRIYLGIIQWIHNYRTPFFVTFNGAKSLGGYVSRGEKGYPIIVARPIKKVGDEEEDENEIGERKKNKGIYFGGATVFNLDQCEGIDMTPYLEMVSVNKEKSEEVERIEEIKVKVNGFIMSVNPKIIPGNIPSYNPKSDVIIMPHQGAFVSKTAYYQSLFHELVHWTGHETRLNRELGNMFGSEKYSKEELVAEIGAATLSNYLIGEDQKALKRSAAYVKSWLTVIKENPRWLFKSAAESEKAVELLIETWKTRKGRDEKWKNSIMMTQ